MSPSKQIAKTQPRKSKINQPPCATALPLSPELKSLRSRKTPTQGLERSKTFNLERAESASAVIAGQQLNRRVLAGVLEQPFGPPRAESKLVEYHSLPWRKDSFSQLSLADVEIRTGGGQFSPFQL